MTRSFLKLTAAIVVVGGTLTGQAQAESTWRFPYKTPYAVRQEPENRGATTFTTIQRRSQQRRHGHATRSHRPSATLSSR